MKKLTITVILTVFALLTACSGANPMNGAEAAASAADAHVPPTQEVLEQPAEENPPETAPTQPIASEIVPDADPEEPPEVTAEAWEWPHDTPEHQGMRADALSAVHTVYDSFPLLSAVIVRNGAVVDTYYKDGYDEASVYTLQSVSKSITSALAGIAIEQGYLENVDVPLSDFFPALLSAADARWSHITLRHLLTHTSGIASTDSSIWYEWRASENWLDYLFALPIYTEPGENFDYSTGNTHLLSAVLEQATGKSLGEYASEVLFEPLGMTSAGVGTAPEGVGDGGNGFYMTTLDLARFGLLYLNGGVWQGQQIVPAGWVQASTTTQAQRASDGSRYGYQWWVRSFGGHPAYVAQGHYGQYIIAVPELSLLIAMNSDYEGSSSIYWQIANDVVAACED